MNGNIALSANLERYLPFPLPLVRRLLVPSVSVRAWDVDPHPVQDSSSSQNLRRLHPLRVQVSTQPQLPCQGQPLSPRSPWVPTRAADVG